MLLVDECPENIHVQLSGAVQETFDWDSRNYTKASASVNGRSYWVHKSAAIWWMNGSWRIGLLTNLGSNVGLSFKDLTYYKSFVPSTILSIDQV